MVAVMEIAPSAVAVNAGELPEAEGRGPYVWTTAVEHGGGSLVDDSDSSYVALSAAHDEPDVIYRERITCDFVCPPEIDPTAVLFKFRLRNNADVLSAPSDEVDDAKYWSFRLSAVDTDEVFRQQQYNLLGGDDRLWIPSVTSPEWFHWWEQVAPDLGNPTNAGKWLEFGPDEDSFWPGARLAFVGDGLRLTFGWVWDSVTLSPTGRTWLDVFEVRLLVAYEATGRLKRKPLRQFPRSDGLGMSSTRRVDANRSQQATLRRAGGTYI